jgi:hypothetical protein
MEGKQRNVEGRILGGKWRVVAEERGDSGFLRLTNKMRSEKHDRGG